MGWFSKDKPIIPLSDKPTSEEVRKHITDVDKRVAELDKKVNGNAVADRINVYAEKHPNRIPIIAATGMGLLGFKIGAVKGFVAAPFIAARDAIKYGKTSRLTPEELLEFSEPMGAMGKIINPKIIAGKMEVATDVASEGWKSLYTRKMVISGTSIAAACTALGAGVGYFLLSRSKHPGDFFSHPLSALGEVIIGNEESPKTTIEKVTPVDHQKTVAASAAQQVG